MLHPVVITDIEGLRARRPAWEALLAESATNEVTLHPMWVLPWWDVFGPDHKRELRAVAFYEEGRMVGFAPLLARRHVYRPGIPFRRLELLASGEDKADETCSDYLGLIAKRGHEASVARAMADALTSGRLGPWDELSMRSMSGESVLPAMLQEALAARSMHVSLSEHNACPYVCLPPTWDAYLALLKKKKRWQLKDSMKTYEEWAGGAPELVRVRSYEQLAEGKRILLALHGERWSASGLTSEGAFGSSRFRAFHERIMPDLLAAGALDLGWMTARGRPVAAFYNLRYGGKISHYMSGRTLDVPEGVRVGVVMNACLIRSAIEEGLREYDFLAGPAVYKAALAPAARPLVMLRVARPSLVEAARLGAERAFDRARRLRDRARRDFDTHAPPQLKSLAHTLTKTWTSR